MHARWVPLHATDSVVDATEAPGLYGHSLNAVSTHAGSVLVAFGGTQSGGPDSQVQMSTCVTYPASTLATSHSHTTRPVCAKQSCHAP